MPLDQNALLEGRIIELLTTTNLTFKEIILKLDSENLSASIGIIRRINRDNRYRRPRYDSKLTPAQRESLVDELRDHQGVKPNLSLLAKRYGVCHGSVWYWWDKLNRIKRCENSLFGSAGGGAAGLVRGSADLFGKIKLNNNHRHDHGFDHQHQYHQRHSHDQQHFKTHHKNMFKRSCQLNMSPASLEPASPWQSLSSPLLLDNRYNLIGRASLVSRNNLNMIHLPVLMFSKRLEETQAPAEAPVGQELVRSAVPEVHFTNEQLFTNDQHLSRQQIFRCGGETVL